MEDFTHLPRSFTLSASSWVDIEIVRRCSLDSIFRIERMKSKLLFEVLFSIIMKKRPRRIRALPVVGPGCRGGPEGPAQVRLGHRRGEPRRYVQDVAPEVAASVQIEGSVSHAAKKGCTRHETRSTCILFENRTRDFNKHLQHFG